MPTRNINLTDHYDQFVEEQIAGGHFKNASEVMRAGLRLLEQQTNEDAHRLTMLRRLAAEGFDALDRGEAAILEGEQGLRDFIRQIGKKVRKRSAPNSGGD